MVPVWEDPGNRLKGWKEGEGVECKWAGEKTKVAKNTESSRAREDRHSLILRITYGIFQR